MKNEKKTNNKKKGAPNWATQPFKYFLDQSEYLIQVLRLSIQGISVLTAMPKVVEAISIATGKIDNEDSAKKLTNAKKGAELAQREIDTGFPIMHAQAVVSLWGFLEAMIYSFVFAWLKNEPNAFQINQIQKLKIRLGEYEKLTGDEKIQYIVNLLEREITIGLQNGVTRFEAMLDPFDFAGEVPEDIRKDIYEFGQVRNVIAHQAGIVDRQFMLSCPWLDFSLGDEIKVNQEMLNTYLSATHRYVIILICRIGEHFGVDMKEFKDDARN